MGMQIACNKTEKNSKHWNKNKQFVIGTKA
jgi:hypothetical protein